VLLLPTTPTIDKAAIAAALDGLDSRGATRQAYVETDGRKVCVNAVMAGEDRWSSFSQAASRRAAIRVRRLLPVLGSGEADGRLWIAYDMGSTTSLTEHPGHLLPTATSLRVLLDVARALDEAAANGLFASELPASSVFVSRRGARLGDLGTAREALVGAGHEIEGDAAYVPPEVLRGEQAGERAGVYLFGALLYHLVTGASPGGAAPMAGRRPDLPASIKSIVATAMADDPSARPASASEAHEMAKRALNGKPPVASRARRAAPGPKRAAPKPESAAPKPERAAPKPEPAAREPEPAAAKPRPAAAKHDSASMRTAPKPPPVAAKPKRAAKPKPTPARFLSSRPSAARIRVGAVAGAVVLGILAGLLLGRSPDPGPATAGIVSSGGVAVTVPAGWHRLDRPHEGLSVGAESGSTLQARLVDRPLTPGPRAQAVQLGRLQAWRRPASGAIHYAIPTSHGTLLVTCRAPASAAPRGLRPCERTASTLRLQDATPLALAVVARESERLRAAIAALSTERDDARARLGSAATPADQRRAAQALAASHERAAAALDGLTGVEPVKRALLGTAEAYATLAAAAESESAARWSETSDRVRRSEAELAAAIAAAG
jgi:hypothetical protein